jgi:hypothetical protein
VRLPVLAICRYVLEHALRARGFTVEFAEGVVL